MTSKRSSGATFASLAITSFLVAGGEALATPYSVLLESNADRTVNEIYLANYASETDLLSNTLASSSAYSALNVSSAFSVGGYTYDPSFGYSVLLESNADRTSNEIYIANYADYNALLSNTLSSLSGYSTLNVSSAFNVGGFTYNGSGYSVLLESIADRTVNEIYIANYASYADLLSNTLASSSAYSALNVSSAFSVGGYTYDPSFGYSVLLESNADRTSNEIYIANYADYNALLSNTLSSLSGYSTLNVSSAFNVGGFTYNGSGYSVLLESIADRTVNEIYIANYASYADLLSNTLASSSAYSALNVSSAFSVGGFTAELARTDGKPGDGFPGDDDGDGGGPGGNPEDDPGNDGGGLGGNPDDDRGDGGGPGGTPIPEPSILSLLGIAYAGFGLRASRRRRYRAHK